MSNHEGKRSDGIQALNRAVDLLLLLHDHPEGMPIRKLAGLARQSPSTTQRILKALEEANLVLGSPRGFRLGPTLTHLARSVRPFDIVGMVHPLLLHLASDTGETTNLAILSHGKAIIVDQARGRHPLIATTTIGTSLPLHGSACGKALLSALPQSDLEALQLALLLPPCTHRTIVEWPRLIPELGHAREQGLAFDHQEHLPGICSVAASIPIPGPLVAAVSIPIPTRRYRDVEGQVCHALREFRQTLQRRWQEGAPPSIEGGIFQERAASLA